MSNASSGSRSEVRSPVIASWVLLVATCLLAFIPYLGFLAWILGSVTIIIAMILGIVVISKGGTWHGISILFASILVVPIIVFFVPIISSVMASAALEAVSPEKVEEELVDSPAIEHETSADATGRAVPVVPAESLDSSAQ